MASREGDPKSFRHDGNKPPASTTDDIRRTKLSIFRHGAAWTSFARHRGGIGLRLLASVLLFSSIVTLTLTVLQLYLDYRREVGTIETRLDEIERSYLGSLGEGLWNLDQDQLELQLNGILRLPEIRAAEIRETGARRNPLSVSVGERGTHSVIAREFPLVHVVQGTRQSIGIFYVEATLTEVYRELVDRALIILVSQGAKTFLVSFFIIYIFHRLVTRHLVAIAEFVGGYDFVRPSPRFGLERRPPKAEDELDKVVAAFNGLCASLQRAYDDLRLSEQRFRDYAETESDWFWESGPEHEFTYISERLSAFGVDRDYLIGKRRTDAARDLESDPEKWREHVDTLERHEPFRDFVYKIQRNDGSLIHVSVSGRPVFDAERRFSGYRGVARDVTAAMRADRVLHEAKAHAEAASQAKSEFLANMSHELRTPLNAIIGLSEMIKTEMLGPVANEHYRTYAGDIHASGLHLLGIVNEVLDVAKIEAGKIELDKRDVALGNMVTDVLRTLGTQASAAGLTLAAAIAPDLPPAHADEEAIRRILFNLLSNALKFTPRGGAITVSVSQIPSGDIELSVADTGIGIAAEDLAKLMQPFTQIENVYQRKHQGTGLGLTLVRSLVELHGGSIKIDSMPDHGTVVTVRLAAARILADQVG
ncbi:MAG: PAS domain S-box protein [Proteobacteria bacterium]|nr:PAS domain S-box protein [Pseudomonadota bacterium]